MSNTASSTAAVPAAAMAEAEIRHLLAQDLSQAAPIAPTAGLETENLCAWLAAMRGRAQALRHPRLAVFCGAAADDDLLALSNARRHPLIGVAECLNADLQVYDMSAAAGQDRHGLVQAITYGMMAVQPGLDLLAIAAPAKAETPQPQTFDDLLQSGLPDLAAMLGALAAARLARIPVILSGERARAAAAILQESRAENTAHCLDAAELYPQEKNEIAQLALALGRVKVLAAFGAQVT